MTEALRSWGFAPGFYACVCSECGKQHTADKRAWRCLDCAESHVTEAAERAAYLRGLEDAAKVADYAFEQECCGNWQCDVSDSGEPIGEPSCCGAPDIMPWHPDEIAAAIRALAKEGGE